MISDCLKNPEFMQQRIQRFKLTRDTQELQRYIAILFCRKSVEKTILLQKKRKEITKLFQEKEFMQNMS